MPDKKVMLSVKKDGDGESEPKKKKVKLKDNKETTSQYGLYSGIVDENGKTNNTPTELEAMRNMFDYMRNNQPPESDNPSNVYRPKFSHITMAYKRKTKLMRSNKIKWDKLPNYINKQVEIVMGEKSKTVLVNSFNNGNLTVKEGLDKIIHLPNPSDTHNYQLFEIN